MILPEEFIWSENRHYDFGNAAERNCTTNEIMWETIDYTGAWGLKVAVMFMNSWPDGKAGDKSASLEFDEVLAIAGSAFTMNDKRIEVDVILS